MSDFADQMSEADEILAFEEGRFEGLKEALRTVEAGGAVCGSLKLREAIRFTEGVLVDIRGDDE